MVVPILSADDALLGVLDIDSNEPSAFQGVDAEWLTTIIAPLSQWNEQKRRVLSEET